MCSSELISSCLYLHFSRALFLLNFVYISPLPTWFIFHISSTLILPHNLYLLSSNPAFPSVNDNFILPFLQLTANNRAIFFTEISQCLKSLVVSGFHPVLVCTDGVLPELDITDAMWLIHYSLPRTKTGFGFRFSCLMKNYSNVFQKSACVSVILVCLVYIKLYSQKDQINISSVYLNAR